MPEFTQLELKKIEDKTQLLEFEKEAKRLEREQRKRAKEAKKRRQLFAKLIAPILFLITVLVAWFLKLLFQP